MEYELEKWRFKREEETNADSEESVDSTVRGALAKVMKNLNPDDSRAVLPLGHGDPSHFPCFRTTPIAEDAIIDAVRSAKFNCYYPNIGGYQPARLAVADYLSLDLPFRLLADDVFLTLGCKHAIAISLTALSRPGANVLLPRPGFPYYEAHAALINLEVRHFDLQPEKGWEVDLDAVETLADENTVAMVVINPGNPCGNVYTYPHLEKIAQTARKLGILVISDEVYGHLIFGSNPFVPMGVFGSITPVLTLGSISKRWVVPGWRLGWIVTTDPNGILHKTGFVKCIKDSLSIAADPPTFIQGAIPAILEKTDKDFFSKIINILKQDADIIWEKIKELPFVNCPFKPEGSMFVMVKLDLSMLDDIKDDLDFCTKLAKEQSIVFLPGVCVGMKNWLQITFATDPSALVEGFERMKTFYQVHMLK